LNLNDKRTRQKILQVINWVESYIGSDHNRSLNSKILRSPEAFGDSQLGRTLRGLLLIKTNPTYKPGEFSQQYRVNNLVLNRLREKLGMPPVDLKRRKLEERFEVAAEHIESGDFPMNDNGLRWYDGLQYIPRDYKNLMWAEHGYQYDYDIECCAPTLFLQQAQRLNPKIKYLEYISFYLENKNLVRDELSIKYNLSYSQVKQLINGLFQGGVLNTYKENKIFVNVLNKNSYKMREIKQDPFLIELIKDISYMWKQLRKDIDTGHYYLGDVRKSVRLTGSHKSKYYQKLERVVMTSVWKYLKKKSVRYHPEHDGFRSDQFVIPNDLEQVVLVNTGFHIKFVWNKVEVDDSNVSSA
jgi:hypothetical protein